MKKNLKITLNGPDVTVLVDGQPVPEAVAVFVDGRKDCGHHQARIGFDFETVEIDGAAVISITEHTKKTLIDLGWTPPQDGA